VDTVRDANLLHRLEVDICELTSAVLRDRG
jgi:hypothetical protein